MRRDLFIDLDGVCYDTIGRICALYNEDFQYYDGFERIKSEQITSWDFNELRLTTKSYIDYYFCQPRFFEKLKLMPFVITYIDRLICDGYKVTFISKGEKPNLRLKDIWIKDNLPLCNYIGVPIHQDKSIIDMGGCIFIDDSISNLSTSNADYKICFGKVYPWNADWEGIRCKDWFNVYKKIREIENEN